MTPSALIEAVQAGTYRIRAVGSGAPWIERKTRLGWVRARAPSHVIHTAAQQLTPRIDGAIKTWSHT